MSFFDKSVADGIRVINEMVAEQEAQLIEWRLENPQPEKPKITSGVKAIGNAAAQEYWSAINAWQLNYADKKSELTLEAWDRFYVIIGLAHLNSDEIVAIENGASDYWDRGDYGYDVYIAYNKVRLFRPAAESMCSIYEFIRDMKDTFGKFLNFD